MDHHDHSVTAATRPRVPALVLSLVSPRSQGTVVNGGWEPPGGRVVVTHYVIRYTQSVIVSFRDKGTEDLFDGRDTKQARKSCPSDLVRVVRRKLDQLNQAVALGDLRAPPSNHLEKLKGEREGQHSIRVNDQWRVCFRWTGSGAEDVEIVDYH